VLGIGMLINYMTKLEKKAGKSEYIILRAKKFVIRQLKLEKFEKFEKDIF